MPLNYFSQFDNGVPDTSYTKDSHFKMIVLGYASPLAILVVVIANLAAGRVLLPAHRFTGDLLDGLLQSYAPGWSFAGVVTGKLGFAAALFSWHALANHERTERWAQPALLASIIVIAIGVAFYAIGLFI